MTAADMKRRASVLSGATISNTPASTQHTIVALDEDEDFERLVFSESEDDDDNQLAEMTESRRNAVNTLIYNDSDDEGTAPVRSPSKPAKGDGGKPKRKFNIFDMVKNGNDAEPSQPDFEIDSEDIRDRLAELEGSDASDNETKNRSAVTTTKSKPKHKRIAIADSDSDDDDNSGNKNGSQKMSQDDDISSQQIRSRLAELADSDSDDGDSTMLTNTEKSKNSSKALIDSEESNDGDKENAQKSGNKRERSVSDDSDNEETIGGAKKKRTGRVLIDSDDE